MLTYYTRVTSSSSGIVRQANRECRGSGMLLEREAAHRVVKMYLFECLISRSILARALLENMKRKNLVLEIGYNLKSNSYNQPRRAPCVQEESKFTFEIKLR